MKPGITRTTMTSAQQHDVYKSIESNMFKHHFFDKVLLSIMKLVILLSSFIFQLALMNPMQGYMKLQQACEYFQNIMVKSQFHIVSALENVTFFQDITNHHIESGIQYGILI